MSRLVDHTFTTITQCSLGAPQSIWVKVAMRQRLGVLDLMNDPNLHCICQMGKRLGEYIYANV